MIYIISDFPMNAGSRALGAYRIATVLRNAGYEVDVIDFSCVWSPAEILEYISRGPKPTWIGFSTTFSAPKPSARQSGEGSELNDHLTRFGSFDRSFFNDIKSLAPVVIGGARATRLKYFYDADYFLTGYADQAVVNLTKYITKQSTELLAIEETVVPISSYYTETYAVKVINCQDSYPVVAVDNIRTAFVDNDFIQPGEVLPLEISRGCIFKCAFCAFPLNGKSKNDYVRPCEQLVEDITTYQEKYQSYNYLLMDDTFNDTVEKMRMMASVQEQVPERFNFWSYGRLDLLAAKDEMIDLIGPTGWKYFSFGVETFNKAAGSKVGKGGDIDRQKLALQKIKDRYPESWFLLEMIVGLPGDNKDSIMESLNWLVRNPKLWDELNFKGLGINNPKYYTWVSDISKNPAKYGITFKNPDSTDPLLKWKHDTMDGSEIGPIVREITGRINMISQYSSSNTVSAAGRHKQIIHQADMLGLNYDIVKTHYNGKFNVAWFLTTFTFYHNYKVKKLATRNLKPMVNRTTDPVWMPKNLVNEQYYPLEIKKGSLLS